MRRTLSIDPAADECAVAAWNQQRLVEVRVWPRSLRAADDSAFVDAAVVEIPQADGRSAPADDLLRVAVTGARLAEYAAGRFGEIVEARPREWKGSLPKAVCHERMWRALSDAERALLGGAQTCKAIANACNRGAKARWKKHANHHYSNRDLPTVDGIKISHDILDAVSLGLWYLGRLNLAAVTKG